MTGKRWTEEEIDFLINNYDTMTNREIGNQINKSMDAVQLKSRKLGLKKESKYTFNSEYFKSINSHDKAYWLGFIYADGYVIHNSVTRCYELGISLKKSDYEHLRKFNKSLEGNIEVTFRKRKSNFPSGVIKDTELCCIRFYSKEIVEDLMSHGILPNKSYKNFSMPDIDDSFKWSFIRGFLDGDGHISLPNQKYKSKYTIGFTSICESFLLELKKYLSLFGIRSTITKNNKPTGNMKQCYQLNIRDKKSFYKFLDYCYENPTVYLNRKYILYKTASKLPSNKEIC